MALFSLLGTKVIKLPPIEAELTKLFSNAYRYISFAISNQFYAIAENLGADFKRDPAGDDRRLPSHGRVPGSRARRRTVFAQGHDAARGLQS